MLVAAGATTKGGPPSLTVTTQLRQACSWGKLIRRELRAKHLMDGVVGVLRRVKVVADMRAGPPTVDASTEPLPRRPAPASRTRFRLRLRGLRLHRADLLTELEELRVKAYLPIPLRVYGGVIQDLEVDARPVRRHVHWAPATEATPSWAG